MKNKRWLLPEGIDEVLPPVSGRLEQVRRELLDMFCSWGYQLVIPPFVEYLDALLVGAGGDLDSQTLKLVDQASGRLLGVRTDMTPQVARIDAHQLRLAGPARLCYLGTVLRAQQNSFGSSRSPLQIGAELYGHSGMESDIEIISLAIDTLRASGLQDFSFDLSHVGIFAGLIADLELADDSRLALFNAVQRKSIPALKALLGQIDMDASRREMLLRLPELNGEDAFSDADRLLAGAPDGVHRAIAYLRRVADSVRARFPHLELHVDLAELRGYNYHTGIVFAAFTPRSGEEVARGGRYDAVGAAFGRSRPATGFSADLKNLLSISGRLREPTEPERVILAPWGDDATLLAAVAALRADGHRVLWDLPGASIDQYQHIQHLVNTPDGWQVQ